MLPAPNVPGWWKRPLCPVHFDTKWSARCKHCVNTSEIQSGPTRWRWCRRMISNICSDEMAISVLRLARRRPSHTHSAFGPFSHFYCGNMVRVQALRLFSALTLTGYFLASFFLFISVVEHFLSIFMGKAAIRQPLLNALFIECWHYTDASFGRQRR